MGRAWRPVGVQRILLLIIITGVLFSFILPGGMRGTRMQLSLPELVALLNESGAQVTGLDLEGWAISNRGGEPLDIWQKSKPEERLGIAGSKPLITSTPYGRGMLVKKDFSDGTAVRVTAQQIERLGKQEVCYFLIKCHLSGDNREALVWEYKIREALAVLGSDQGLYITVQGTIGRKLEPENQLAWGRAIYRKLGGNVARTQKSGRYLSLNGYTAALPDAVTVGGERFNLNVALVIPSDSNETNVYLGTPLITSEY